MLEILKEQYQSKKTFTEKNQLAINRSAIPNFFNDVFPIGLDYYHEFNPQFTFNVSRPESFRFAKTFTVRDGSLTFCHFLLRHFQQISKLKTHFIIHPDLAHLVPNNLKDYFFLWEISHSRKISIKNAKKLMIFSLPNEQYIFDYKEIPDHLKMVDDLPHDAEVEVFLPPRKNPFENHYKETTIALDVAHMIKKVVGDRKITFLTTDQFFDKSDFHHYYFINLRKDRFVVADCFMDYYVASRGGTVESFAINRPQGTLLDLELGLYHHLHIKPFSQTHSSFAEMLFYRKQTAKDLITDPIFHQLVRDSAKK